MQNSKEKLGQLLIEGLEGFEEDLPVRVWENVSSELAKEKDRKKTLVYLSIAASIAIIIAFGSGYFLALKKVTRSHYSNNTLIKRPYIRNTVKSAVTDKDVFAKNKPDVQKKVIQKTQSKPNHILPSEEQLQKNALSHLQDNTNINEDTLAAASELAKLDKQENSEKIVIDRTPIDSVNINKPLLNLTNNFDLQNNYQNALLNKNNNVINKIPEQKEHKREEEVGRWTLAEQFSPVYSIGMAQKESLADAATQGYSTNNLSDNEKDNPSNSLLAYATGIYFKYQLNKKWGVKSGLFYAKGNLSSGMQHKQIEVPLMADFELINKKFLWTLDGGLSANFLFSGVSKNINYSALAGTTLGYNISQRIAVSIQPTLKYNFSFPNSNFHYYPISFAFYTGLSYKF